MRKAFCLFTENLKVRPGQRRFSQGGTVDRRKQPWRTLMCLRPRSTISRTSAIRTSSALSWTGQRYVHVVPSPTPLLRFAVPTSTRLACARGICARPRSAALPSSARGRAGGPCAHAPAPAPRIFLRGACRRNLLPARSHIHRPLLSRPLPPPLPRRRASPQIVVVDRVRSMRIGSERSRMGLRRTRRCASRST